jgi:5'(3')-deoxyribonucleotidase
MDKHIAVDLDDVVLDFVGGLRIALKKEYNVDLHEDTIKDFNLAPYLDPIIGRSWWAWLRDRDWLWQNFPAVDGAIGTLEKLRLEGYYLELVTSKPKWAEHATYQWLGKWRPPFQRVTIVSKDDVKADFTDARILIDDKMQNIKDFVNAGRTGLLFTRPHNRFEKEGVSIIRVNNWQEVYREIKNLTSGE